IAELGAADAGRRTPARGPRLTCRGGRSRSVAKVLDSMTQSSPLLNSLQSQYRGELSAIQVYERALQKFVGQPEESRLEMLRDEHRHAASRLGALIRRHGGVEPQSSGPWGSVMTAIEGVAALFNDEAPLRVLHRGEVHGHEGYA